MIQNSTKEKCLPFHMQVAANEIGTYNPFFFQGIFLISENRPDNSNPDITNILQWRQVFLM